MAAEAELLERVKSGDSAALAQLYDDFSALIFSFAERIAKDKNLAESVVQDVFLTVWRRADQFAPDRGTVCTWLLTMTRSKAIDALRSSSRRLLRQVPIFDEPAAYEAAGSAIDPLSAAIDRERRERILHALSEIPDEQKVPIYMNFYDGLSHPEIAERLQVPLGTVKTRIRLGLEKLRLALKETAG